MTEQAPTKQKELQLHEALALAAKPFGIEKFVFTGTRTDGRIDMASVGMDPLHTVALCEVHKHNAFKIMEKAPPEAKDNGKV